ncbi:carboxypeptidase-like regulatory domain-containing protein [Aquimarina algiphila]|uniref:carboxypeptidase-like regulatory domain-containing protein n=1 Tax=Aquimarina algiphila TaxID=2047982 RepID=UPI00232AB6D1|nr:carboxypeptidase-like regulatory domain-containing protein [Aquimarina algiphila]
MSNDRLFKIFGLLLVSLTSSIGCAQEHVEELIGKVQSLNHDISNVLIINLNNKKTTITNAKGLFKLEVNVNDTLQFSAVHYSTKEIMVTKAMLHQKMIFIDLQEKVIDLDEVTIQPHNLTGNIHLDAQRFDSKPVINSSSLGLPQAKVKVKTKNERLLFEADDGKFVKLQGSPFGVGITVNTHKIMNRISGKTKALKNRLVLDEHIKIEKQIANMFPTVAYSKELGIPQTHIEDFLSFCIHQTDFPKPSDTKNPLQIWEYIKGKSNTYKKSNGLN